MDPPSRDNRPGTKLHRWALLLFCAEDSPYSLKGVSDLCRTHATAPQSVLRKPTVKKLPNFLKKMDLACMLFRAHAFVRLGVGENVFAEFRYYTYYYSKVSGVVK